MKLDISNWGFIPPRSILGTIEDIAQSFFVSDEPLEEIILDSRQYRALRKIIGAKEDQVISQVNTEHLGMVRVSLASDFTLAPTQ